MKKVKKKPTTEIGKVIASHIALIDSVNKNQVVKNVRTAQHNNGKTANRA